MPRARRSRRSRRRYPWSRNCRHRRIAAANRDLADARCIQRGPIDPAAEGIVERHPVQHHQGAACPVGADSAQAHPLRGGVGHERRGAAEQRHARNPGEQAIQREGGRIPDFVRAEARYGERLAGFGRLEPRRHHDLLDGFVGRGRGRSGCGETDRRQDGAARNGDPAFRLLARERHSLSGSAGLRRSPRGKSRRSGRRALRNPGHCIRAQPVARIR